MATCFCAFCSAEMACKSWSSGVPAAIMIFSSCALEAIESNRQTRTTATWRMADLREERGFNARMVALKEAAGKGRGLVLGSQFSVLSSQFSVRDNRLEEWLSTL